MSRGFTQETTERQSDMLQFTQLDSDSGPQRLGAETTVFSDDGNYHGHKAAKRGKK